MKKHYFVTLSVILFTGLSATAAVFPAVNIVNPPAVLANDDNVSTSQDTGIDIYVLFNDDTSSGLALETLLVATQPAHGTVVVHDGGTPNDMTDDYLTYTPNPDYNGTDSFVYQISDTNMETSLATVHITITANGIENNPVAVNDMATTLEDNSITIPVLANDTFGNAGPGSLIIAGQPLNGIAVINQNGTPDDPADDTVTYTPNASYYGTDAFQYTITDFNGTEATGTVMITITEDGVPYDPPLASDDTVTTSNDTAVVIDVLINDTFGTAGPASFSITTLPANGNAIINTNATPNDPTDDTVTYTPNPSFFGADTFVYTITDAEGHSASGTVTIVIVTDGSDEPPFASNDNATLSEDTTVTVNVLANDWFGAAGPSSSAISISSYPQNGIAFVNENGTPDDPTDDLVDYIPNADFNGIDSFTYTISDSIGNTSTTTVTLVISPDDVNNDMPLAMDDTASTSMNTAVILAILANDTFGGDGASTTAIVIGSQPSNGIAVVNDNGTPQNPADDTITYTPNEAFTGTDSFTYTISDADGQSSTATTTLQVIPTADIITAVNDAATTTEDSEVTIPVLANDSFGPFGFGDFPIVTNPAFPDTTAQGGTVSVQDNGTPGDSSDDFITYSPAPNYNGVDIFTYTITSSNGDSSTATVTLLIVPDTTGEPGPIPANDQVTTPVNTLVTIDVLANDQYNVFAELTGMSVGMGQHGTTAINNNNTPEVSDDTITYTPENGFAGTDSFIYTLNDPNGFGTAIVTVLVVPENGILMSAFIDNNGNGVQDGAETTFKSGVFHYEINNDGMVHDIVSSVGQYVIYEANPSNTYDLSYTVNDGFTAYYTVTTPAYENVTISETGVSEFKFAINASVFTDVSVQLIPTSLPRPGFIYHNMISYRNNSAQTVSGTVLFVRDNNLSITSVSQPGIVMATNGFTYNFTDLAPFETRYIYDISMQVPVIPNVALGDLLTNGGSIFVSNDALSNNNDALLTQPVVGSYDPNDITESHGEKVVHADFTADDYLTYTIRFENTGTANAENIRVENELDEQLDETTIEMIDASDDYTLERTGKNLVWNFTDVQLPPSEEDTQIGHGYIVYKIKPKPGYAIGDIIPNGANIYFDFNPAVVTNVFMTEFVSTLHVGDIDTNALSFYPNPVKDSLNVIAVENISEINIINITGQKVLTVKPNAVNSKMDLSGLESGMYIVSVKSAEAVKTIKIIKE
ncbi:Ig-like domain-containing protein [Flavobacterium pallidum]|nr:Ig-like domain-containing protein [Flavobacterium pallidum]